ncbi:NCS2 family permease [Celerinatantimonas sp. MCCC 1A17872]|uniref:NCS2 family permease n=1 Tax=Celerinatantimonas sp. MCCC 1A17872 TaxID=3177514 RepID=UPI0038C9CF13
MQADTHQRGLLARWFKFAENGTSMKREIIGGITTFATMAYIIAVVPGMLSHAGIPFASAMTVTILMTAITTLGMAFYTNRPFVLGPGLGSVAIFSFTLLGNGVPIGVASGIIFISGIIFMLVSFFGVRDFIVTVIPHGIKVSVGVGIGLFIALLGAREAGLVIANAHKNVLNFGDLTNPHTLLAIASFFLILVMSIRKIQGGILISIIITTIAALCLGLAKMPTHFFSMPANISDMAFKLDISGALEPKYLPFLLAFFIPDFFSTLGTLLGVGAQAGYLDKDGNLPGIDKCFHVDSTATTFGSLFSCPVLTTYLESSAGVEAGGRTGFTAVVTAICFLLTLFIAPIATTIPEAATAPVLMFIGINMMKSISRVNFSDVTDYLPAFICIVITIFTFNAGNGIAAALVVYAFLKLVSGRAKEDHWSVYLIGLLMLAYFYNLTLH